LRADNETGADKGVKSRVFYGEVIGDELVPYFNTSCMVYDYSGMSDEEFAELCTSVEQLTKKYHRLFDIYHSYEGMVNLYDVNNSAGGEAVSVSPELYDSLEFSKKMHDVTGGEVNICAGSVLSLWHDARQTALSGGVATIPSGDAIAEAMKHMDIESLLLTDDGRVGLLDEKMSIDAGAIAKGYAVERIAEWLEESGYTSIVLDFGGNLRAIGEKPSGDGWMTGIIDPLDKSNYIKKLEVKDVSVVTSGDYQRGFTVDGKKYHHIIDLNTGYPSEGFSSVTVITPNSGIADALSTALFCMSLEEGRALVESLEDVSALWIFPDGSFEQTDGFGGAK
jgi:thiamine biosynthesis lipoprotein